MRDKDSSRSSASDEVFDKDPDFDSIVESDSMDASQGSDINPSEIPDPGKKSQQELHDRIISTVEKTVLSTSTKQSIDTYQPSVKPNRPTETIGVVQQPTKKKSPSEPLSAIKPAITGLGAREQSNKTCQMEVESVGVGSFERERSNRVTDSIQLQNTLSEETERLGTVHRQALISNNQSVSTIMTPQTTTTSTRPEPDPEELDPGYHWIGGMPYATTTPQCIVHIDPDDDVGSLSFLQRVLRDTYTELEGGRPRTETVNATTGTVTQTRIHGSVVTLDLSGEAWELDITNQRLSITHDDREVLPEIQNLVDSLYGGKLGYLILNIDAAFLKSRFRSDLRGVFVASLLDKPLETIDLENNGQMSSVEPPIRIAEPRCADPGIFQRLQAQYFGFDITDINSDTTTGRIRGDAAKLEASLENRIRRNSWHRIALTERQDRQTSGESDEHYLWKATLVDSLAWDMKEGYVEYEEQISFERFVHDHLISDGPITSEAEVENDCKADLKVSTEKLWAWRGVDNGLFERISIDLPKGTDIMIEFETGRSEGAFNFRKIRETLDKYDTSAKSKVCVVVPSRILFRSESRARMIQRLVTKWGSSSNDTADAILCVPELGQYGCRRLVEAGRLLDSWFGDTNE